MKKITLPAASKITSPNPVSVVCTQKPDGSVNIATVSWWTYLSYNPSMIAYAMQKPSYSGEMVRLNKKVVLTVPGECLANTVLLCGSTTGRNTNKVEKFNVEMQQPEGCSIPVPKHSALAIDCTLKEYIEAGDHYLYICTVNNVWTDESERALFAWNGYREIRPAN